MSATFLLTEADLHGLVDDRIEPSRRGDVLRRVAASPGDRARVEAWQEQNALIRNAFIGLDKEPLPASLKLVPPPALQCVPAADTALVGRPPPAHRTRATAAIVTIVLATFGLGASWTLLRSTQDDPQPIDLRLRGTVDESLANQAAGALETDRLGQARTSARSAIADATDPLPTAEIPDLTPAGFIFTSAEAKATPQSLVFHYRDASANRIVVSVARAPLTSADTGPTKIGRSFSWHRGDNAFAIAGTVRPERLRAMATLLQGNGEQ